jgi:hypothetical protein
LFAQANSATMSADLRKAGQAYESVIASLRADLSASGQAGSVLQEKLTAAEERVATFDAQAAALTKEVQGIAAVRFIRPGFLSCSSLTMPRLRLS